MPGHGQARRAACRPEARLLALDDEHAGPRTCAHAAQRLAARPRPVPAQRARTTRGVEQSTAPSTARSRLVGLDPLPPERRAAVAGVTDSWGRVTSQSLSVRLAGKMGHPERPRRLHPR